MTTSKVSELALVGLLAAAGVFASPSPARAEEPFPGALQEAAELSCAPTCSICHTTNPGTAGTWIGKKLGLLIQKGGAKIGAGSDEAELKAAYAKILQDANGGDALAKEVVDSLKAGLDPDTGAEICQVTYGCGAHIVKETPRDDWSGLLFVAGAMGFGALLRRTKRR